VVRDGEAHVVGLGEKTIAQPVAPLDTVYFGPGAYDHFDILSAWAARAIASATTGQRRQRGFFRQHHFFTSRP